jgi:hypothetical protein
MKFIVQIELHKSNKKNINERKGKREDEYRESYQITVNA